MTRSMTIVALLTSLLLVLQVSGAIADMHVDPEPPIAVTFSLPSASPDITTVMQAQQVIDYVYTVNDQDTYTGSAPPPPPAPYTPFTRTDRTMLENISWVGDAWGEYVSGTVTPFPAQFADRPSYTLHLVSHNDSDDQQNVSVAFSWDDEAFMPVPGPPPPPPMVVDGESDDATLNNFQKYIQVSPY